MKPTIDEMIAVMQAYKDGKTIEYFYCGEWVVMMEPSWNWHNFTYRVKPEPVEIEVWYNQKSNKLITAEHVNVFDEVMKDNGYRKITLIEKL